MKNTINFLITSLSILVFAGCAQQVAPIYKWGNYIESSSAYGMKGHEKDVLEKHLAELNKIITESENDKQRVAPGIYAEYAQILFETGKKQEAKKYFELEKHTYPESTIFIDRVLIKLYGAL